MIYGPTLTRDSTAWYRLVSCDTWVLRRTSELVCIKFWASSMNRSISGWWDRISSRCFYKTGRKEMFYLMTHSTHFIYGYMASDIWLRTIPIVRKETRCCHIGYSFRLTTRVLLYAPSHRQDSSYHSLCYTSRAALAGTTKQSNSYISPLTWQYRVRKRIYVSIDIKVSDKQACRHSLWHGQWLCPWHGSLNTNCEAMVYLSVAKDLTWTFRGSRYSVCLLWVLVLIWVNFFVQDKEAMVHLESFYRGQSHDPWHFRLFIYYDSGDLYLNYITIRN